MTFKFQPLGIPDSSSFAVNAKVALASTILPATGSSADFSLAPAGPNGRNYLTANGTIVNA
jgi:hypothetical protein